MSILALSPGLEVNGLLIMILVVSLKKGLWLTQVEDKRFVL